LTSFVLDASVTLSWCFDEGGPWAQSLLDMLDDSRGAVPSIWSLEVANVVVLTQRKGRISDDRARDVLQTLARLPIDLDMTSHQRVWGDVVDLARKHNLTVYDAAYLELAARLGLPLATLDHQLIAAAELEGIPLLQA
jgi:predicted nucleic acid-binding protein